VALSGKVDELVNGVTTSVQYFQNGRLERNPASQLIGVGGLGGWAWDIQCTYVK
jgi:hypothetical protein